MQQKFQETTKSQVKHLVFFTDSQTVYLDPCVSHSNGQYLYRAVSWMS